MMCVRCTNAKPINFRTVPIGMILRVITEKETIQSLGEKVTNVTWFETPNHYFASIDYEFTLDEDTYDDVINFQFIKN